MIEGFETYTNTLILHLKLLQTLKNQGFAREPPEKGERILMTAYGGVKLPRALNL